MFYGELSALNAKYDMISVNNQPILQTDFNYYENSTQEQKDG